jgi:hypothetical protein
MIRTWTGPVIVNQDFNSGLWQALNERDDHQFFEHCESTQELAIASLDRYLDDERYPMLTSTRIMLDKYQQETGMHMPQRAGV